VSTILAIACDVADDLSIQRPSTLFPTYNEGDSTDRKLFRALAKTCQFIAASYDWSVLQNRHAWAATAAEVQPALPSDWLRMVMDTAWDETLRRPLCGPLSPQEWAEAKSSAIGRIEPAFVLVGTELRMVPAPPAGRLFAVGYVSNAIGTDASGARIARFGADNDRPLWDDELVTLGTVYHWRKAERYDYAQDEVDFRVMMQDRIKRDGGGRVVRMGGKANTSHDMVDRMKSAALFIKT
jgi:hypothetical protein